MNVARWVSSIATSSRQTRASEPRATTMSLSATSRSVARDAAAQDPSLDGQPLLDAEPAVDDRGEHGLQVAGLRLRQEADLAQVDADERHVHLGDRHRSPQERAVAAEHDQDVRGRQLTDQGCGVARGQLPLADATHPAPARGASAELDRRLDRRVVGEPDAGHRHGPVTSAIRSPISAQPGPAARWTQELAVAGRPGDRRGDDARACPRPSRSARRRRSARGPRDGSPGRGRRHGRSGRDRPRTVA